MQNKVTLALLIELYSLPIHLAIHTKQDNENICKHLCLEQLSTE
jgi:hypothetical protein